MTQILLLTLAGLGIIVGLGSLFALLRSCETEDRAALAGLAGLTVGGLLYEGGLIGLGRPTQLALLSIVIIALAVQAMAVARSGNRFRLRGQAFLPAVVAAFMFLANSIHNAAGSYDSLISRFVPVVLWLAVGLTISMCRLTMVHFMHLLVLAVALMAVYTSFDREPWRACDQFKCGPFGQLLTGPFVSENFLAQLASICILLLVALPKSRVRAPALVLMALMLFATGSRTSQLALLCAVVMFFASRLISQDAVSLSPAGASGQAQARRLLAYLFPTIVVLLGIYLFLTAVPSSFSNRGGIWLRGLAALGADWPTGLGLERWIAYQEVGLLPPHFPHSEALLLLFGGGVMAVSAYWLLLVSSTAVASRVPGLFPLALSYGVFFGVTGLTEALWNPITLDGHSFLVIPFILIGTQAWRTLQPVLQSDTAGRSAPSTSKAA